MGARAAGDRVDDDAARRLGPSPGGGPELADVEQLVEPVDPGDAELAERGGRHGVGARELAGVGAGHRRARVGAPDLHAHDRHAGRGRVVGGEVQRAAVLETLDVGRDHAGVGLVGEPAGEVGELEVDLVARRRPVR